jgi:hypothetical protein
VREKERKEEREKKKKWSTKKALGKESIKLSLSKNIPSQSLCVRKYVCVWMQVWAWACVSVSVSVCVCRCDKESCVWKYMATVTKTIRNKNEKDISER